MPTQGDILPLNQTWFCYSLLGLRDQQLDQTSMKDLEEWKCNLIYVFFIFFEHKDIKINLNEIEINLRTMESNN